MTDDVMARLLSMHRARAEVLVAAFDAADPKDRARVTLVEYRCRQRRCALLVAWQAPGVRLVRLPPYKLSRARNERETVASARAERTSDGDRHWNPRVLVLDELGEWGGSVAFDLNCDHVKAVVSAVDVIDDADRATPGGPTRRSFPS